VKVVIRFVDVTKAFIIGHFVQRLSVVVNDPPVVLHMQLGALRQPLKAISYLFIRPNPAHNKYDKKSLTSSRQLHLPSSSSASPTMAMVRPLSGDICLVVSPLSRSQSWMYAEKVVMTAPKPTLPVLKSTSVCCTVRVYCLILVVYVVCLTLSFVLDGYDWIPPKDRNRYI
jgi:hypothetical protein